jgi:hypothetical protein
MSTACGPRKHGKDGPLPKHMNGFAFKHQPNSRKTNKILSIPATSNCCNRCCAIIEWKRKYRCVPRSARGARRGRLGA